MSLWAITLSLAWPIQTPIAPLNVRPPLRTMLSSTLLKPLRRARFSSRQFAVSPR